MICFICQYLYMFLTENKLLILLLLSPPRPRKAGSASKGVPRNHWKNYKMIGALNLNNQIIISHVGCFLGTGVLSVGLCTSAVTVFLCWAFFSFPAIRFLKSGSLLWLKWVSCNHQQSKQEL